MLLFCEYSHSKLIDLLKTFTVTYLAFESNIFFDLKLYTYPQHTYLLHTVILPDWTLKNGASLILPSSIARNSKEP